MNRINLRYFLFAVIAAVAAFSAMGHPIVDPDYLVGMGALPMVVGDITMVDLKQLIDKQGEAFEAFKRANDALIAAKAEGKAIADLDEKVAKVNAHLTQLDEAKAKIEEALVKANRPSSGADEKDAKAELKSFNDTRRLQGHFQSGPADIDLATYEAYKSAFWNLMRKGNPEMLTSDERKAMTAGTDSEGGYLLPTPTVGMVAKRVYELSPIRQIATVQPISTNDLEGINDLDEAAAGWVAEIGTRSESSTPAVGKYRIEAFEMYAMPKVSQRLLDDAAVDIEGWLAAKVADKFARTEAAAFITGDGVGKPRGFADYDIAATGDATRAWGVIENVKSGLNGGFTNGDELFTIIGACKQAYLANASWVTRREVIAKIRKLKTSTTLEYIWQPGLQAGQPDRLLGYPIVNAQDIATPATGSRSMYFGDFREAYTIVDRMGIRLLRDPFTAKPYIVFYNTKRVGGGVVNFEAIKCMDLST